MRVLALLLLIATLCADQDSPFGRRKGSGKKKGPTDREVYQKKLEKENPETADDHASLAQWCRSKGFQEEAKKHWEAAIRLDAEHEKARKALGHKKVEDKWLTEEEWRKAEGYVRFRGKWIKKEDYDRQRLEGVKTVKIKVGIKPNATKEWYEEKFKPLLIKGAASVWNATEGNMAMVEFNCEDQTGAGTIVITNLDKKKCDDGAYGRTMHGRHILLGGDYWVVTFLHEWGHWEWRLPEEYGKGRMCKGCAMGNKGNMTMFFCDNGNHSAGGASCWSRILKKYPNWKRRKDFGEAPTPKITFKDN